MTSGGHLVQHHHAKQDQLQCYIGLCPVHSWLSPRMEISQLFNAKFDHSHSNHVFLLYLIRISLVSADFHPLLCISEESSLHLPVRYLQTAVRPVHLFFLCWTDSVPSACPCVSCSQPLLTLVVSCWIHSSSQWLCTGEATAGNNTWAAVPQLLNRREDPLFLVCCLCLC